MIKAGIPRFAAAMLKLSVKENGALPVGEGRGGGGVQNFGETHIARHINI